MWTRSPPTFCVLFVRSFPVALDFVVVLQSVFSVESATANPFIWTASVSARWGNNRHPFACAFSSVLLPRSQSERSKWWCEWAFCFTDLASKQLMPWLPKSFSSKAVSRSSLPWVFHPLFFFSFFLGFLSQAPNWMDASLQAKSYPPSHLLSHQHFLATYVQTRTVFAFQPFQGSLECRFS